MSIANKNTLLKILLFPTAVLAPFFISVKYVDQYGEAYYLPIGIAMAGSIAILLYLAFKLYKKLKWS